MQDLKISCPNCRQVVSDIKFISNDYNRRISSDEFIHMECGGCGVITIANPPKDLSQYYPNTYHHPHKDINVLKGNAFHESYKIDIVKKFKNSGELLEIGPSYGAFTYLASQSGFSVTAIEMDKECCNFLKTVVDIDVIESSEPENALKELNKKFDVICLWHVIEHLPNPFQVLSAMFSSLKEGGIIVLAAPNPDAYQFKLMGKYWPHVDAPRHLYLLPAKTISEHLVGMGMTEVLATTRDQGSLAWNVFGWEYLLMNLSDANLMRRVLGRIGRLIGWAMSKIDGQEGKGAAYTLVFKK